MKRRTCPQRTAHAYEADEGSPRGAGMGAKLVYATKQRRAFRGVSCSYSGSLADSRCRRVGASRMCRREN